MVFTLEQDQFILEAYFRTGNQDDDGEWSYSVHQCREQFLNKFLDFGNVHYDVFCCHIRRIVERFRRTGSVCKGKSSGRKPILTQEVLNEVQDILTLNPETSVRSLAKITGMSFGTCHRAIQELKNKPYKPKPKVSAPKPKVPTTRPSSSTTPQPAVTQDLPNKIQGRRIVDLQYFFDKLKFIGSHKKFPSCSIASLVIMGEISNGLSSELQIFCNRCKSNFTCPLLDPKSQLTEVNKSAVVGSVEAGIGYDGLMELFDNIGVPAMSEEKYREIEMEERIKGVVMERFVGRNSEEDKCEPEDCDSTNHLQKPDEVFIKENCNLDYYNIDIKEELL